MIDPPERKGNRMNDQPTTFGRRSFITGLTLAGLTTCVTGGVSGAQAAAEPAVQQWDREISSNGWPIVGSEATSLHAVEGSPARVALLPGEVAVVLTHVLRRFHYEVLSLGYKDVLGYTADRSVRAPAESNYLSGTAVAIRPERYPLGLSDGFEPTEAAIIRDIIADCEGAVRWGADIAKPKEGHFQIDVLPNDPLLGRIVNKLASRTAGTMPDPFIPSRKRSSSSLASKQRRSR